MRLILRFIADGVVAVLLLGACSHRSETQTNRAPAADAELKQLAEPDHTFESLTHIYTVMAGSNEGDPINTISQDHQSDLIRLLESSRDNRIITLATLILFKVNTPEAKAALAASHARTELVKSKAAAAEKQRETEPQTLEQITATISPSNDPAAELRSDTVERILDENILLTIHRATNHSSLMELWQKQGDRFRFLRKLFVEDGSAELEQWQVLSFSGNRFLHVTIHYPGTGSFRDNHVFYFDPDRQSLEDVKIFSAPSQFRLPANEEIQRGEQTQFKNDSITFWFGIWKKNTCGACAFDAVTGTYEIKKEGESWVMRPAAMKRRGTQ